MGTPTVGATNSTIAGGDGNTQCHQCFNLMASQISGGGGSTVLFKGDLAGGSVLGGAGRTLSISQLQSATTRL